MFVTYLGCLNLKELKHFILKDLIIISVCVCASVEVKDNFADLSFHTYVDSEIELRSPGLHGKYSSSVIQPLYLIFKSVYLACVRVCTCVHAHAHCKCAWVTGCLYGGWMTTFESPSPSTMWILGIVTGVPQGTKLGSKPPLPVEPSC